MSWGGRGGRGGREIGSRKTPSTSLSKSSNVSSTETEAGTMGTETTRDSSLASPDGPEDARETSSLPTSDSTPGSGKREGERSRAAGSA